MDGFHRLRIEDMIAGGWTLNVMCGGCEQSVELIPKYFRRHGDGYSQRTITKMRFRRTKCGERERFKLTTFEERYREDNLDLRNTSSWIGRSPRNSG